MRQELILSMHSKLVANQRFLSFLIFLLFLIFFSFLFANVVFEKAEIVFISSRLHGKKVSINVELASTEVQKMRGFMQRRNIPEGTGMIFLYDVDTKMRFWMKDTPSPLSIAFISSSGVIKEIKDMSPYSLETVSSTLSVRYALEVPQGMLARLHLAVGDALTKESLLLLRRASSKE